MVEKRKGFNAKRERSGVFRDAGQRSARRETAIVDPLDILPGGLRAAVAGERPVLIAGPTASGKSALAVAIAERFGGIVVNADALQVYDAWPILTARPGPADLARAPHHLFGHLPHDATYSAGDWLRAVAPLLGGLDRPVVVGGTGLYFTALTAGLADIPAVPPEVRAEATARLGTRGLASLAAELDARTAARIDRANPARVLRAWEVLRATGRGLADWQADTPPPLLPLARAAPILIDAPKAWLDQRAADRFDAMLAAGAPDEARAERSRWNPALQSARAIGAAELIAYVEGRIGLPEARTRAIEATRQYAKRQRTWFAARRAGWHLVSPLATVQDFRR